MDTILDPSKKLATDKGRKVIDNHFLRPDFWGDIRRGKLMVKAICRVSGEFVCEPFMAKVAGSLFGW